MEGIRVLREIRLLGADRKFGDVISKEEAAKIAGPSLRALVELRDIELLGGSLDVPEDNSRLGVLEQKLDHLIARVDKLTDYLKPAKTKRKTTKRGGKS